MLNCAIIAITIFDFQHLKLIYLLTLLSPHHSLRSNWKIIFPCVEAEQSQPSRKGLEVGQHLRCTYGSLIGNGIGGGSGSGIGISIPYSQPAGR